METCFEGELNLCFRKVLPFPEIGPYYNSAYHKIIWFNIHSFSELDYSFWQKEKACGMQSTNKL